MHKPLGLSWVGRRSSMPSNAVNPIQRLRNGETQPEIARTYGVDATTIGRVSGLRAGMKKTLRNGPPAH